MELIRNFTKLGKNDAPLAGGKGASLGEMTRAGIPVPPGFVVLSSAFEQFLAETDLSVEIDSVLHTVNHQEMHTVEHSSETIQKLILEAQMPKNISQEIKKEFKKLNSKYVAVRSSATAEDSASAAWAGQLESYLNTTEKDLLSNVQRCWASLFTPRAIFYRFEKGLHNQKISVAVVIQKMVESEKSGIAFSVHPVTEDHNQLIIEAGYGLGEAIVSGQITPDSYVVEKEPRRIVDKNVVAQERGIFRSHNVIPAKAGIQKNEPNEWYSIEKSKQNIQKLTNQEILELSELILKIENHYGTPQDIEWAFENKRFYIVQSRPITTLTTLKQGEDQEKEDFLNQIKNIDWKYLVNRREALLFRSFTTHCYNYFYETTQIDWQPTAEFRPGADLLYSEKELGLLTQKFIKGDVLLLNSFYKRLIKYVSQFDNIAHKISKINFAKMKNQKLGDVLEGYIEAGQRAHTFLLPMPLVDPVISKHILSLLPDNVTEKKRQYWLGALIYPSEENEHTKEERSFYQLAEAYKAKSKNFTALLNKHLTNFSWIGARWYFWHNAWNKNDVIKRLEEFIAQGKNPKQELKHLNQILIDREHEMHDVFKKIKLSKKDFSKLKDFVELAKKYAYARTWRTDVVYRAGYLARHLFEEIASRAGFGKTDAQYMTFFELRNLVCSRKISLTKDEILKRREFYGSVLLDKKYVVFSGLEWKDKLKSLYSPVIPNDASEIKGIVAYHGKVKGIVKVIHQTEEMGKVNRGDILVAVMTFPNLVPAMEKAVAFVTDEGGILCHAAIISREMKKPCIIGTKIATQVLHDGDLVEVDADKGIVRILKLAESIKNDTLYDKKKKWTHYLTRPFTLFGASLWQEWYNSRETINVLSAQMKDALFIEQAPGVARNYRVYKEFENFKNSIKTFIKNNEEKALALLEEGIKVNKEARRYISGVKTFDNLDEAVNFLVRLALRATILPYWVVAFSDEIAYQNKNLLPLAEKLRATSFYPDLVSKIVTPLAQEKLTTLGIDQSVLPYITIRELLSGNIAAAQKRFEANNQNKFFVYQALDDRETISFVNDPRKLISQIEHTAEMKELRGQIAFSGKVSGTARIVYSVESIKEFHDGDILVSINSNPSLMPLIKKCGAIVTDEGGIMCHAAIVARELKKPCIIGTKIATQVLHDGDLVEVDAERGVVTILKKAGVDRK